MQLNPRKSKWKLHLLTHTLAGLLGASVGFTVACYAIAPNYTTPKYKLNDFKKVPPIPEFKGFAQEKFNEFKCIGTEKDCGPVSIPNPSTLLLIGCGLVFIRLFKK